MKKNNIINEWLSENNDPVIERLIKRNLAIANKVRNILDEKGLSDKDLAKMLNKTPSEISKWLSGTHNLTQKSIVKMELALEERLIYVEPVKEYVHLGIIKGNMQEAIKEYTEDKYQETMPSKIG
ncbi:MAG: helix-turn-helix transcriptional regulator [Saonia sp.]